MSDEPFALSTIPPALPAEADYDALCAAVMGTGRGRWFLEEYARRNRNADTTLLLKAIERIEAVIRGDQAEQANQGLRIELLEMAKTIAQTRAVVAEIKPEAAVPGGPAETAAEIRTDIVAKAERLQEVAWAMREHGIDFATCDQIDQLSSAILNAPSLRSPSDERARKLGEVLQYLERRIDAMLERQAQPQAAPGPESYEAPAPDEPGPAPAMATVAVTADAAANADAAAPPGDGLDPQMALHDEAHRRAEAGGDEPASSPADHVRARDEVEPALLAAAIAAAASATWPAPAARSEPQVEEPTQAAPAGPPVQAEPPLPAETEPHLDFAAEPQLDFAAEPRLDFTPEPHLDFAAEPHLDFTPEPFAAEAREPVELEIEPLVVVPVGHHDAGTENADTEIVAIATPAPEAGMPAVEHPALPARDQAPDGDVAAVAGTGSAAIEPAPLDAALDPPDAIAAPTPSAPAASAAEPFDVVEFELEPLAVAPAVDETAIRQSEPDPGALMAETHPVAALPDIVGALSEPVEEPAAAAVVPAGAGAASELIAQPPPDPPAVAEAPADGPPALTIEPAADDPHPPTMEPMLHPAAAIDPSMLDEPRMFAREPEPVVAAPTPFDLDEFAPVTQAPIAGAAPAAGAPGEQAVLVIDVPVMQTPLADVAPAVMPVTDVEVSDVIAMDVAVTDAPAAAATATVTDIEAADVVVMETAASEVVVMDAPQDPATAVAAMPEPKPAPIHETQDTQTSGVETASLEPPSADRSHDVIEAPHESEVLSAAWEIAVTDERAAEPLAGARSGPSGHVPSMWEPRPLARAGTPVEPEPADFLLEPLPMPVSSAAPADERPAELADELAAIEDDLFDIAPSATTTQPPRAPEPLPPTVQAAAILQMLPAAAAIPAALATAPAAAVTIATAPPPIVPARAAPRAMPRPAENDPLAALKAMSDEERIALFT